MRSERYLGGSSEDLRLRDGNYRQCARVSERDGGGEDIARNVVVEEDLASHEPTETRRERSKRERRFSVIFAI